MALSLMLLALMFLVLVVVVVDGDDDIFGMTLFVLLFVSSSLNRGRARNLR